MHTNQPKLFAAIRSSHRASAALAATHVRLDGASITGAKSARILGHFHYFSGEFMPQHAWICVNRVPARKSVKIASANSDSVDSNQSLSAGGYWARDLDVD
jgi:hypothetical protein